MNFNFRKWTLLLVAVLLFRPTPARPFTLHYDPATGMVAFDTATSPSGKITTYELTGVPLVPKNLIRISNSPFYFANGNVIGDRTDAGSLDGYYAIGEIIVPGLSEPEWLNLFGYRDVYWSDLSSDPRVFSSRSMPGSGNAIFNAPTYFSYGLLDRPFNNATKLLDLEAIQWAETASLRYDPSDGRLILDTSGPTSGYISLLSLEANADIFDSSDYQSPVEGAFYSMADGQRLAVLTDVIPPDVYNLGRVMPPGLTEAEFLGLFDVVAFNTRVDSGSGRFDVMVNDAVVSLVYLPEPSTGVMIFLALLGGTKRNAGRISRR